MVHEIVTEQYKLTMFYTTVALQTENILGLWKPKIVAY